MQPTLRSKAAQGARSLQTRSYTTYKQPLCLTCRLASLSTVRPQQRRPERVSSTRSLSSGPRLRSESTTIKESLQPQTHYDYFPICLGPDRIPPKGPFKIDLKALRNEFLQLQSRAHPDRAPADQKRQAEGLSARINEAYKTLQNPLLRAQYLLSLRGIDVAEDETAKVDDPELLMEVLETRETIEEAKQEEDLSPLKEKNDGRIESSEEVIGRAFKDDNMEMAKEEAVKLRYWVNIKESIDGWEKGKPVVLVH